MWGIHFATMGWIQKTGKQLAFSEIFEDVYWSKEGGLAEKKYVFVEGNQLRKRWEEDFSEFVVCELGFGSGLSFFATWQDWKEKDRNGKQLHFISLEKYPLDQKEILLVLEDFPEIQEEVSEFLEIYSLPEKGIHRFSFPKWNLKLSLCIGEALDYLKHLYVTVDAFFLDGFSPSKNPDLWSKDIFLAMKNLSKKDTSFATYSVSRSVKDNAMANGFQIATQKGFGTKKEMLVGFLNPEEYTTNDKKYFSDFYKIESTKEYQKIPKQKSTPTSSVAILGGGLAGVSLAYQLALQKISSILVDEKEGRGMGASGNRAGIFSPVLTANPTIASRLTLSAYEFLYRELYDLQDYRLAKHFQRVGVFQHISSLEEKERIEKGIRNHSLKKETAEIQTREFVFGNKKYFLDGVYFPKAGFLSPALLVDHKFQKAKDFTSWIGNTKVANIQQNSSHWVLYDVHEKEIAKAEILVLANSTGIAEFPQTNWLKLQKNRGQICLVPKKEFPMKLDMVLTHDDGYLIESENFFCIGATYNHTDESPDINPEHNQLLAERLQKLFPEIEPTRFSNFPGRVGFRSVLNDRIPIVGQVPDRDFFVKNYFDLQKSNLPDPKYIPGLFVLGGLGSRGISYSGYLAELLSAMITGKSLVIETDLLQGIIPTRFLLREFKKSRLPGNLPKLYRTMGKSM